MIPNSQHTQIDKRNIILDHNNSICVLQTGLSVGNIHKDPAWHPRRKQKLPNYLQVARQVWSQAKFTLITLSLAFNCNLSVNNICLRLDDLNLQDNSNSDDGKSIESMYDLFNLCTYVFAPVLSRFKVLSERNLKRISLK